MKVIDSRKMIKVFVFILTIISAGDVSCKADQILKRDLPILLNQTKFLAESVCSVLFPNSQDQSFSCQKNFLSPLRNVSKVSPSLVAKCQKPKSITFVTPLSKDWKLVVLISEDFGNIQHILMPGVDTVGTIFTPLPKNYTFWTAALSPEGRPSLFLRGPDVGTWRSPSHKEYDIKMKPLIHTYKRGSQEIQAKFSWNAIDELDSCFHLLNVCDKKTQGDIFEKSIQPNDNRSIVVNKLPLGDHCRLRLNGRYGVTQYAYNTPHCYEIEGCTPSMENIKNMSMDISEAHSGFGWSVRVSWDRPMVIPMQYNATLFADTEYNIVAPGNATEVLFDEVSGEGPFNVSLVSSSANEKAYTSRQGFFPISDKISNVSTEILESKSGVGWRVLVRWERPRVTTIQYNVTLYTDAAYNAVLPGNATDVLFDEIPGEGPFNVSLVSTTASGHAYASYQGFFPIPEISNVSMEILEAKSGIRWNIRVKWDHPRIVPISYNATLYTDTIYNIVVPANATEVLFEEIADDGLFNVTLEVTTASGKAYASRQGYLPPLAHSLTIALLVVGAWVSALLFVVTASIFVYCKKRRSKTQKYDYLQGIEEKFSKDGVLEVLKQVEDQWEVDGSRLTLHEVVGEGAFGLVRRATLVPSKEVAVKMLKDFPTMEEVRSFRDEMELMKSVGAHPHVVSLLGCCTGRRPLIIVEYCSMGDLLTYLRCSWDVMLTKRNAKYCNINTDILEPKSRLFRDEDDDKSKIAVNKLYDLQGVCDELTCADLLSYCRQIAMGMEFLASNRVVHRDLAARNVLVTGDKTLKIADFGLSRDVYQDNQYKQKGNGKMPVKWMALESLTHRIFTTYSDVWSFGVVMWEVVTLGGAPYPTVAATRLPRLLRAGYRMPRPVNCTQELYDVMVWCWRARPSERPTFAQLRARLDELLTVASADRYLTLDFPSDLPLTPTLPSIRTVPTTILNGKAIWERRESYERPNALNNRYTTLPVTLPA